MTEQCDCENIAKCGFFAKYSGSKELACKGFMVTFCKGAKKGECKRRAYRAAHGVAPPDDMMPNGMMVAV